MTPSVEHYYMALSDLSTQASSSPSCYEAEDDGVKLGMELKDTELRLGLPGLETPERMGSAGLTLVLPRGPVSGAKRGFNDTVDGSGKWVLSRGCGEEGEFGMGGKLLSLVAENGGGFGAGMESVQSGKKLENENIVAENGIAPVVKEVVGWPPIRSYRKNTLANNPEKIKEDAEGKQGLGSLFVKVSMDGAPYLRKVDLKTYSNYREMSSELGNMFSCFTTGLPAIDGLTESRLVDLLHGSEYVLTYEDKDCDWMLVGDVPWEMFTNSCRRIRIMKGSDAIGFAPRSMEKRA
ncbi:hypothetical protein HPP92_010040 [Vanilla planifolia]|uniref:Auxin-responsive protein n=1 Tax=Vanilla planifolia TaxID=51239 RepID=A0A835R5B5_VANPL|nr:hypothetical protein HPP92_010040 [Vanilla planifolia]